MFMDQYLLCMGAVLEEGFKESVVRKHALKIPDFFVFHFYIAKYSKISKNLCPSSSAQHIACNLLMSI